MCGIITIIRKDGKNAVKQVLKAYESQKTRGVEGFGFVASSLKGKIDRITRTESENEIRKELKAITASSLIMFHHRQPTSTPNFAEVAHPIRVSNLNLRYNYYVIHNGVIMDSQKLKEKHEKQGFNYSTSIRKEWITSGKTYYSTMFNDSESLAIELANGIEKSQNKLDISGSIAFVAIQTTKDDSQVLKVFYGRNERSPLKLDESKDFMRLASEGSGKEIDEHTLYELDLKTLKTTSREFMFGDKQDNPYGYNDYSLWDRYGYDESDFDYSEDIDELKAEYKQLNAEYSRAIEIGDDLKQVELENDLIELEYQIEQNERAKNRKLVF
jgi:predicted glutamine amidotransferase